ncbi:MAG: response regulator transcription factor [Chitinophagaceae bacterium]|nr:response regulator transcription factor [Chitinophagaceae bacterium]
MIKAIIIDDDKTNIVLLKNLLSKYGSGIEVCGEATNIEDAIDLIQKSEPQLLFLDIELHNKTGFDILQSIDRKNIHIIVITAHEKYALQAIKFDATDYLLKPIQIEEFVQTLQKVKKRIKPEKKLTEIQKGFLTIPNKDFIELIAYAEIIHLESDNTYTYIVVKDGKKYLSTRSLKEIEDELADSHFLRVHRSYVININEIKGFTRGKSATFIMSNKDEIPISQNKRKEVFDFLNLD